MLNGATDHIPHRIVLYARVSTERQASDGYSLAQQMEALRKHATSEGYEVLEEVVDRGYSGATLQRPGLDRVRRLVATGAVSVVLAQDRDRIARESTHHQLLKRELNERGCELKVLNDLGIADDRFVEYEQAKIVERTWRGKLRKAREGRIVAVTVPNYGFRFNATRNGYEVDEDKMRVVRRIFYMVGVEKRALNAVKRTLEAEQIPSPTGKRRWATWVIRRFILDDVYRPYAFEEVAKLITPEVAARLDPGERYGIWWFNRERWRSQQFPEGPSLEGHKRLYRRSVKVVPKPKEEWIAVPVPDSGVPRDLVDATREVVLKNKPNSNGGDRFWELSGGILRCGVCGRRMRTCTTRKKDGRRYFYYACAKHHKERDTCPNRRSYRAQDLETAVQRVISDLLANPSELREAFEAALQRERDGEHGDLHQEAQIWLEKLEEAERMRHGFQEIAATGLMTLDELSASLDRLENTQATALRELDAIVDRRERKEELERGRDVILGTYAGATPGVLESMEQEERHRLYRKLRLEVLVGVDGNLDSAIAGSISGEAVFSLAEWDHHPGRSRGSSLRAPRPADPPESAGNLRRT
jgi:site-specific DNA recombinase